MGVMLGGPKARGAHIVGDLVVCFQYVNNEPAMVMWPRRKRTVRQGAYCICLSSAWKYADDDYLVRAAVVAARYMGMGEDPMTINRIASAINNNLEELVKMKPEPDDEKKVIGEGTLIGAGGSPIHFDMTDGPQSVH